MAQFAYVAVNKSGERIKGTIDAPNEAEVRVILRAQALRPVRINKPSALEFDLAAIGAGSVSDVDVLLFTRQLSILISSGIPLVQGLDIIASQLQGSNMKRIVLSIREKLMAGSFLWEAMKPYDRAFPDIYISMVRAGEAAGALDIVLKRLIKYLDDAYKLKKMVRGAMVYPIMVTIIGVAVMAIMLVFVIPKFEDMLRGGGQELPELTQVVINLSHFFQRNIHFICGGLALAAYSIRSYYKSEEGRNFFDYYSLKIPLFGPMLLKVAVARFSRTMQTLLSSGINLLDALDICKDAVGNRTLAESMIKMKSEVESGKTLANIMGKLPIFPSMVVQMVTVGENTGNLDKMLERVADYYEEDVQGMVANLTKLIEPFVLVFLGGGVGGLMIAMYLPIFKMAGGTQ